MTGGTLSAALKSLTGDASQAAGNISKTIAQATEKAAGNEEANLAHTLDTEAANTKSFQDIGKPLPDTPPNVNKPLPPTDPKHYPGGGDRDTPPDPHNPPNEINYPSDNGALDNWRPKPLGPGDRVDRWGGDNGHFVAPKDTPFGNRSLPPSNQNAPYSDFEVVKPIDGQVSTSAPFYGQPGYGEQIYLPHSVGDLIRNGSIVRVNDPTLPKVSP